MAVILPVKADLAIDAIDQTLIGNSYPMRITTQILEDLPGAAKRWLGVNHPIDLSYRSQIAGKGIGILQRFQCVKKVQLPGVKGSLQLLQKQPAKQPRQDSYGQNEAGNDRQPNARRQHLSRRPERHNANEDDVANFDPRYGVWQ